MMSSTDAISAGSVHDYSGSEDNCRPSPLRSKRHSPNSKFKQIPEDVKEEIEELLENVPEVDSTFAIEDKIGAGTFSSVYVASLKKHVPIQQKFALKHIIPTSHPSRIENELRCLQQLGGQDNVMGVKACLRAQDHVVIVMPYFAHDRFENYVKTVTVGDVRNYMENLFIALRRVHDLDIIHRDVKPSNFLVNSKLKKYALVDFGLAQKAPHPLREKNPGTCVVPLKDVSKEQSRQQIPTSPRRTRRQADSSQVLSPRKRKINAVDAENFPESPRKRKQCIEKERGLAEVDLNKRKSASLPSGSVSVKEGDTNCRDTNNHKPTAPVPTAGTDLFKSTYDKTRSPRRMLLTKRALDLNHGGGPVPGKTGVVPVRKTSVVVHQNGSRSMYKAVETSACQCFGQPMICNVCISRSQQVAPRAGTPGFRAPEVLMKCPDQSTAVDMWSAGVILLSLLSGRYPFFKAEDDMTALAQIISIIGTEESRKAARSYGKELQCSPSMPPLDLRVMCENLRGTARSTRAKCSSQGTQHSIVSWSYVPDSAYNLLGQLLTVNPSQRITAEKALLHPFITEPNL